MQKTGAARLYLIIFLFSSLSVSFAQQKGPGGVGVSNGTGTLRSWWRADAGVTSSGGSVSVWADQSGYGNNLLQATAARQPTTTTSVALNGQPVIRYNAANAQWFGSLFSGPAADNFTLFLVANGTSYQSLFRYQNTGGTFVVYPWEVGGGRTFILSSDGSTPGGIASGLVNSVNNVGAARYRRNTTVNGMQTYLNGGVNAFRASVDVAVPSQSFFSGVYSPGPGEYPTADVGEMIAYYTALNDAQMIIVQNYLAAKFNVTLTSNDVYTMDNAGNGNYDFDVAGIGRVNATNLHSDAQGTGIVRIFNPAGLDNNEYLMWGRDNGAAQATNTTDIPAGVSARFARTWRVSETGEVGNVDIDVDLTGLSDFATLSSLDIVARLRLLVDTDNDGVFNDQNPIFGATSIGSNAYRFSGVSALNNNVRFTLALGQAQTYYSIASGAWEDNTRWSLSADGSTGALPAGVYPTRIDNVVINTGHTITVNNVADNGSAGVRPDDLLQANIGPFGSSNLAMFYQTGSIVVRGALNITGIEAMIGGYTWIQTGGALSASSNLVVTGNLQSDTGSTLSTLDDLILTGRSSTIINTASTSSDDLIIDHNEATLCGTGTTTLQNGAGSTITYVNSATLLQVCTTFVVNCTGVGCTGFPVAGSTTVITGYTGPAGVGSNAGDSQLKIWFRVDNGLALTGANIDSWTNSAGIPALNISETGAQRPTQVVNAVNGYNEVSFNGSNRLRTGLTLTASNFVSNQASSFVVNRADNTSQTSSVYTTDPLETNRFSSHIPWATGVYFDIGVCCSNDARLDVQGLSGLDNYSVWSFDANAADGKQLYRNGSLLISRVNTSTFINQGNYRFNIGSNIPGANGFVGDVTEVLLFNTRINLAERMIVENYLSAKYGIAMASSDLYVQDDAGNGNFDYDVAGIGRASDGSTHKDSQGTGIVRMWAPQDLGVGEFLIWGRNSANLLSTTMAPAAVDGTIIKERLTRVWRVSESGGDVGTLYLSFDTDQFPGNFVGSNLRLLIDRDGDGFQDNDVTPIIGTFSSNKVIFANVNLQNGDRFTLGNTSSSQVLPITLMTLNAKSRNNDILVTWKTASEIDNDYFEVLRSDDAEHWSSIGTLKGAGTTNKENSYGFSDERPLEGKSYYRLKQVDYDGKYSLSRVVSVDFEGQNIIISPNPSEGIFNLSATDVYVEVYNIQGKKIISTHIDRAHTGIDLSDQAAGVYVVKIYKEKSVGVYRIVKK